jgi:phosphoribosylamine--glycine ligase
MAEWIAKSQLVSVVHCASGSSEISQIIGAERVEIEANNVPALLDFAKATGINVTVFGSEKFSAVAEAFKKAKLKIIEPEVVATMLRKREKFPARDFM